MNYLTRGGRFFLFRVGCYDVNGRVGGCNMDETEHIIQIIHPPTVLLQIDSIISAYAHFPYFSVAIFFHKNEKKNINYKHSLEYLVSKAIRTQPTHQSDINR